MGNGVMRYTNGTNGGPIFVYVKDGKIIRTTPIDFDDEDAPSWSIKARGKTFTPPRRTTLAAHGACQKSMVYSKNRILYPMKRVDFDPDGNRNIQNRGKSEFVRISWDEALDIVSKEIKRAKAKGPGADRGRQRFAPPVGQPRPLSQRLQPVLEPDRRHQAGPQPGQLGRLVLGRDAPLGQQHASRDAGVLRHGRGLPERGGDDRVLVQRSGRDLRVRGHRSGAPGPRNSASRWCTSIPYMNHTAAHLGGKWISPKPGTDAAFAQALCHVWITEGLYDKDFVEKRTTGFEEWKAYILGAVGRHAEDPRVAGGGNRACRRATSGRWPGNGARKKTYLGAGGWGVGVGGACRGPMGVQWARMMTILGAMQGIRAARLQLRQPAVRRAAGLQLLFPRLRRGQLLRRPPVQRQCGQQLPAHAAHRDHELGPAGHPPDVVPRGDHGGQGHGLPDRCRFGAGPVLPGSAIRHPATCAVEMLYKYGSASFGTMVDANRWVRMYQHENLKFVVNQSVWKEGETPFADIILPACTVFETLGHQRVVQRRRRLRASHVFDEQPPRDLDAAQVHRAAGRVQVRLRHLPRHHRRRLDLGAVYSEGGTTELDWCKRVFDSSDMAKHITWRKFLKKGYFVVPPDPEHGAGAHRQPLVLRRPEEGHAGALSAAVGLRGRVRRGAADAVGQVRVHRPDADAHRRSGPAAAQQVHADLRGPEARHGTGGISPAAAVAALALPVPRHG